MRTAYLVMMLSVALALETQGQPDAAAPYAVASRTPHETVWQRVEWETNRLGRAVGRTNAFVELATGLNFFEEATQAWLPSREEWEVYPEAIVARWGRHKVLLAHNLNLDGSVDVLLPSGEGLPPVRLVSSPVSLGFYDPIDGKQVVIAEVKDCVAERGAAANEIVFRDCFDRVRGSIRYLYTKAGVHQHVVLEQRLELPPGFSEKSRLECYTVFAAETPSPQITTRILRSESNPVLRAQMVEPDFTDAEISFGGAMAMRAGRAFSLGAESEDPSVRVGKQFQMIGGEPVLIEAVEFKQIEPLLARLAAVKRSDTSGLAINATRRIQRATEQARLPREHFRGMDKPREIQLASNPLSDPAVVIDYELLASATNFTFKGDTTYFVSGSVNLSGTTYIEGSSVVKFTNVWWPKITISGPIRCQTGPYQPAIFTVTDDNSVGQAISGSTGNPTNNYGSGLAITSLGNTLTNVRFAHLYEAVSFDSGGSAGQLHIGNAQFVKCRYPLRAEQTGCFLNCGATIQLDNALITACDVAFRGEIGIFRGRHVTVNQCNWLGDDFGSDSALYLTNSLLVAVSNWGNMTYTTNTTVHYATDPGGIFQTVGAGSHYLADGSTNRDAGTTNIHADLLAALKTKTTYPPVVLSNVTVTVSTNLLPQVQRDTDGPDLGFHYEPLDFILAQYTVTNATLNLSNGVAIGYYNQGAGIWLQDHSAIHSIGSPLSPNWFAHYTLVQEQPVYIGNVGVSSALAVNPYHYGSVGPNGVYRFTHFSTFGGTYLLIHSAEWAYSNLLVQDCQLWNGWNYLEGKAGSVAVLKNNLFERSSLGAWATAGSTLTLSNNLARNTEVMLVNLDSASLWRVHDNAFDHCEITSGWTPLTNSHNAYINCAGRLQPTNVNDVVMSSFNYASGPLGDYYQASTNLLDAGSVSATDAGLYYFTTTTNQVRENDTVVDIGFHYAADLDGDGIPDYADADADGDGLPDAWEIQNGLNPLVNDANDDPDGDWITNVNEYNGGTNSTNPRDVMVVAWGNNSVGQCDVPGALERVVALAGGFTHTLALKADGTLVAWGEAGAFANQVPAGLAGVKAVAAGWEHNVALLTNGAVTAWGLYQWPAGGYLTAVPANLTNATAISVGALHSLALQANGFVVGWGVNDVGQTNVPASLTNAVAIAAGGTHSLGAGADGTVLGWGLNNFGQCTPPSGLSNVVALAAGWDHSVALRDDGTVVAWGSNAQGQTNVPPGLSNVVAIAANYLYSLALKSDHTVVAWGGNAPANMPAGLTEVLAIGAGHAHAVAVRTGRLTAVVIEQPVSQASLPGSNITFTALGLGLAGVTYQWQFNGVNISGATNATLTLTSVGTSHEGNYQVIISTGAGAVSSSIATFTIVRTPQIVSTAPSAPSTNWLTTSTVFSVVATAAGTNLYPISYQWRRNGIMITNATAAALSLSVSFLTPYNVMLFHLPEALDGDYSVEVSNAAGTTNFGTWKVRALLPGGVGPLLANDHQQLGRPTDATNLVALAAGLAHSLGVKENGTLLAWGSDSYGQALVPVNVTNATAVAAGDNHSLALRSDGTIVAWGRNNHNQANVPGGLTNVVAVAAGGDQCIALRYDGTLTNWGNVFGVIPADLTNAVAVAAGLDFCLALRSNRTVIAWGQNAYGQTNVPTSASNIVAIAASGFHALALREDGHVITWGSMTNTPGDLTNVMAIAAGAAHNVALRNDGVVVAWGANGLLHTNTIPLIPPVKVIAAGGDQTLLTPYSALVEYPVHVSKDLLLIYNTNSLESTFVKDYYLTHRPYVTGANVLGIGCTNAETALHEEFTNQIAVPLLHWLQQNPTKHPQYVILFPDIPTRASTNRLQDDPPTHPSVSVGLHDVYPGWKPFITHINMGSTNSTDTGTGITNDCVAYINKLSQIGAIDFRNPLMVSAHLAEYGNDRYYFDDNPGGGTPASPGWRAREGVREATPEAFVHYVATNNMARITNGFRIAAYYSTGGHSTLGPEYPLDGTIIFGTNSSWYLIGTSESYNGRRTNPNFGTFVDWYSASAFGGTNYSNTPIGAVSHVNEPGSFGNDPELLFGFWARGRTLSASAWNSRRTPHLQVVGDPFVRR